MFYTVEVFLFNWAAKFFGVESFYVDNEDCAIGCVGTSGSAGWDGSSGGSYGSGSSGGVLGVCGTVTGGTSGGGVEGISPGFCCAFIMPA